MVNPRENGIPEMVDGEKITAVDIGMGTTYYDREVNPVMYIYGGDYMSHIKVARGVSPKKIFDYCINSPQKIDQVYRLELDLSELDGVVIPEELFAINKLEIYVSEAVKANYPNVDKVKVKQ